MCFNSAILLAVAGSLAGFAPNRIDGRTQPATVLVRVIDELSRRGLPNADVTDLATGQHRFTDENGETRVNWPADGQLRLRVREIGYQPVERTIRQDRAGETATFELKRVAYVITPVKATSRCVSEADSASLALSVSVLEQLKQGAERYDQFRRAYPFEAPVERRTALVPPNGKITRIMKKDETFNSDEWEIRYRPGDIIKYEGLSFTVPILFLSTLADSVFWDHHCFIVRGVEDYEGSRVIRLEFSPSADTRGPDWMGAAFIDSATSYLRRINFQLANANVRRTPSRLEGYTTFRSPSPYVVIPDTTFANWWRWKRRETDEWGLPEYLQALYLGELKYKKRAPPRTDAMLPDSAKR